MVSVIDEQQGTLLNLNAKKFNPYWVDEKQEGILPENPLHYKAHRLQILLDRLDKQASSNPAQFNSKNYIDALNEWSRVVSLINKGVSEDEHETLSADDTRKMGGISPGTPPSVGQATPLGVGNGIPPPNPFSR